MRSALDEIVSQLCHATAPCAYGRAALLDFILRVCLGGRMMSARL